MSIQLSVWFIEQGFHYQFHRLAYPYRLLINLNNHQYDVHYSESRFLPSIKSRICNIQTLTVADTKRDISIFWWKNMMLSIKKVIFYINHHFYFPTTRTWADNYWKDVYFAFLFDVDRKPSKPFNAFPKVPVSCK